MGYAPVAYRQERKGLCCRGLECPWSNCSRTQSKRNCFPWVTKVDIENEKVDIQDEKVDIESVLSEKGSDFSVKTTIHIHRLFEKFGFDEVFGRSAVMELLGLKGSGASKLLSNLVQADIIEPVSGHGKGKYKFKK